MKRLFKQFSLSRRHSEPRRAGDAGLDPRGRRTRLFAVARLRRGVRQSRPDRRLRRRRRRGGDRAARRPAGTRTSSSIPVRDGAVLPILHLNGYKIANPTVLARIPHDELDAAASRLRLHAAISSRATSPTTMHQLMAATLDTVIAEIQRDPARRARRTDSRTRPRWPMIVLRTPKGWTGPKVVDGKQDEGYWRAHQVPMGDMRASPSTSKHPRRLDEELPARGAVRRRRARSRPELAELAPAGRRGA